MNLSAVDLCLDCLAAPADFQPPHSPWRHRCQECRAARYAAQATRTGSPPSVGCSVQWCPEPHRAGGYCDKHYRAARRHDGDPLAGPGQGRGPRPNRHAKVTP